MIKKIVNLIVSKDKWRRFIGGYRDFPYSLIINISSYDNLKCRMCPFLELHNNPQFMTTETFKQVLPVLPFISMVHFTGIGEPLFNKDLILFINLAKEKNSKIKIWLTTNGTLLTESLSKELIKLKIDKICISIDGAKAETVESIRRGINFSQLIRNINILHELKMVSCVNLPIIRANYTVGYGNYAELLDFIKLGYDLGLNEISFDEIQSSCFEDYKENFLNNLIKDAGRMLNEAFRCAKAYNIKLHFDLWPENECCLPFNPFIIEDGSVFPCPFLISDRVLYVEEKVINLPTISFGNVNKSSFRKIWNSKAYRDFRKRCKEGRFSDYCQDCYKLRIATTRKIKEVLNLG